MLGSNQRPPACKGSSQNNQRSTSASFWLSTRISGIRGCQIWPLLVITSFGASSEHRRDASFLEEHMERCMEALRQPLPWTSISILSNKRRGAPSNSCGTAVTDSNPVVRPSCKARPSLGPDFQLCRRYLFLSLLSLCARHHLVCHTTLADRLLFDERLADVVHLRPGNP